MEDRGHLSDRYNDEGKDLKRDLWADIEKGIVRKKKRPSIFLWFIFSAVLLLGSAILMIQTNFLNSKSETSPVIELAKNQNGNLENEKIALIDNGKTQAKELGRNDLKTNQSVIKSGPKFEDNKAQSLKKDEKKENSVKPNEVLFVEAQSELPGNSLNSKGSKNKLLVWNVPQKSNEIPPAKQVEKSEKELQENEQKPKAIFKETLATNQTFPIVEQENEPNIKFESESESGSKRMVNQNIEAKAKSEVEMQTDFKNEEKTTQPEVQGNENPYVLTNENSPVKSIKQSNLQMVDSSFSSASTPALSVLDSLQNRAMMVLEKGLPGSADTILLDSTKAKPKSIQSKWSFYLLAHIFNTNKDMKINQKEEAARIKVQNANEINAERFSLSVSAFVERKVLNFLSVYSKIGFLLFQDETKVSLTTDRIVGYEGKTDPIGNKFVRPVFEKENLDLVTQKLYGQFELGLGFFPNRKVGFRVGAGLNQTLWMVYSGQESSFYENNAKDQTPELSRQISLAIPVRLSKRARFEGIATYFLDPALRTFKGSETRPLLVGFGFGYKF